MPNKQFLAFGIVIILIVAGWMTYDKATDDTYEGMSIIPEEHEDIPLYDGLKPTQSDYVIKGNQWRDIYHFYTSELPSLGWKATYHQTALDDDDASNDWAGFYTRWEKEGFDGEISVSASYIESTEETEVRFNHMTAVQYTTWFEKVPDDICVGKDRNHCVEVTDEEIIEFLVSYINHASDSSKVPKKRENAVSIDIDNTFVTIHYEEDEIIYIESSKGIKTMKPETEFIEGLNNIINDNK
ncbi:hypothetical protein [Salirhabdus salicampi]|uniref:hypothetical protein n=1 Tax=Salirhabdus salicampi TaxID=476102 RepID=UPI0020C3FDE0|nr:hypothetical protein [Salirhabdus salicampi]MCP8615956.1 hypothetical protein [Salirhabdus salicampi]